MHLVKSGWSLRGLLHGAWQEQDLVSLPEVAPLLARRVEAVAESPRFGTGRPLTDVAQAAMVLGQDRVRHVTFWHLVLEALDPQGVSEAVTLAGHALGLAEQHGMDRFQGIGVGLSSRLAERLLEAERSVPAAVRNVLACAGGGARLEQAVYGTTGSRLVQTWSRDLELPGDLQELTGFTALRGATLEAAGGGEEWALPPVAHELARMLQVRVLPVAAPRSPEPEALVEAVLALVEERAVLDGRIEALQEDVSALREELTRPAETGPAGLLGATQILERVHMEVGRAKRYKRHLSVVAIAIDPEDYSVDPRLVLEHMAGRFQAAFRSSDAVGLFDGTRLVVVLPETPVSGARLFSERTEYAMRKNPMEIDGVVVPLKPRLYGSSLEQQSDQDADGMLFTVLEGVDAMQPGERVKWNTHGQSVWRVNG